MVLKIFISVVVTILISCSNYSSVVKNNLTGSEQLLIQSPKIEQNTTITKTISIVIDSTKYSAIPDEGYVDKEKTFVLPLLVWNSWDHISKHYIGTNQIDGSINEYIQRAFEQALVRKGYTIVDNDADIKIIISPKKIESTGKYEKDGFFYFLLFIYGYGYSDQNGPYESSVNFEIETSVNSKKYLNEIEGYSMLTKTDFSSEVSELGKVSKALEYSIANAIIEYIKTLPN